MRKNIFVFLGWCGIFLGLLASAQAQIKILESNTGIAFSEDEVYLTGTAVSVGSDFLAVRVQGPDRSIMYIFDLKRKSLAMKLDQAGIFHRYVRPSATTSSFVVEYEDANQNNDAFIALYNFDRKRRTWSLVPSTVQKVTTGYATAPSSPLLPGYFVNSVRRSGILWLDVYRY